MPVSIDMFTLPGYQTADAAPAQLSNDNQTAVTEYKIPPVVWMFFFLIAGYFGIRMLLED